LDSPGDSPANARSRLAASVSIDGGASSTVFSAGSNDTSGISLVNNSQNILY
jgi:hypothetical protein